MYGAANNEGDKNDYHKDWTVADGSDWEEPASLVLLSPGLQVGALTKIVVVPREDALPQVFFLALLFIVCIFTLQVVVTLELLLQTDLVSGPLPISCSRPRRWIVTIPSLV